MFICFCINNLGSFGLGATLNSLLQNCSDSSKIHFYFFCSSLDAAVKSAIKELLNERDFEGSSTFIDFNPDEHFQKYRSLQGDRTPYGRLLIPETLVANQILYLDSDLVIETDVLKIEKIDLKENILGAVGGTTFRFSLEHDFYINQLHINPEAISFNSGVLLINIAEWNKHSIKKRLLDIADKYPNELLSADQTLLNGLFAGNFYKLDVKYNLPWYANNPPSKQTDGIFHFVGSPKPWDLFGRHLHTGYRKWKSYETDQWAKTVRTKRLSEHIKRAWTLRRSYFKILVKIIRLL